MTVLNTKDHNNNGNKKYSASTKNIRTKYAIPVLKQNIQSQY